MIVLVNLNSYLGGGETLFVRFALYLQSHDIDYLVVCTSDSFIYKELRRNNIPCERLVGIKSSVDYYYLSFSDRKNLIDEITSRIPDETQVKFLTFCMRDLYTIADLNRKYNGPISHLILHNQDYLYVCQTLLDKVMYKLKGIRQFSDRKTKSFNKELFSFVNNHKGLISMSWIITQMWKREVGITMPESSIVPDACIDKKTTEVTFRAESDKTILWIGRLVDFKLSSLYVILNFIKRRSDYQLSIVGDGNKALVEKYIRDNNISESNINFIGQVKYEDLKSVILNHSIGYASGSSIIEMTKYGLPVVMALQDNKHTPFTRDICGGLFCNTSKGNFAEDLCIYSQDDIPTIIDKAFEEIENDYLGCAKRCHEYTLAEYDEATNFAQYLKLIEASEPFTDRVSIPRASFIRTFLFNKFK